MATRHHPAAYSQRYRTESVPVNIAPTKMNEMVLFGVHHRDDQDTPPGVVEDPVEASRRDKRSDQGAPTIMSGRCQIAGRPDEAGNRVRNGRFVASGRRPLHPGSSHAADAGNEEEEEERREDACQAPRSADSRA